MEEQGRILALDVGDKRIGVAVSDPFGNFPVGLETLIRSVKRDTCAEIAEICAQYNIERVIIGIPRNLRGQEGPQAEKVRRFSEMLAERIACPIEFLDERLTSVIAQQTLHAQGVQPSRNKGLVDQVAAGQILQDYLTRRKRRAESEAEG